MKNSYTAHNLRLLFLLALIPILLLLLVFLYSEAHFDRSTTMENDIRFDDSQVENITISEKKNDFASSINRKMQLPEPKVVEKNYTTKEDKRMLDSKGAMITVELQAGQTLEALAQKRFGHRAFWVYFYDVNRDKLNSPDDVKAGMKLYVPNPEFFGFSANDNGSIQYAKQRGTEILNSLNSQ